MTIHKLTIETARPRPSAGFHGQVEIGHWFVDDDTVWLCDEDGVRTGDKLIEELAL